MWQRFVVLVAGPLMNLFLAFVVYLGIAAYGAEVPVSELEARVGMVREDAPAESAPLWKLEEGESRTDTSTEPDARGWQTGDLIVSLNGEPLQNITNLAMKLILAGPGVEHEVVLKRESPDGSTARYFTVVAPELLDPEKHDYPMIGAGAYDGAEVKTIMPGLAASESDLQEGDIIRALDGSWVDFSTFSERIRKTEEGQSVALLVERDGDTLETELTPTTFGFISGAAIGLRYDPNTGENADALPEIRSMKEEWSQQTNLQRFDKILEIDGEPATAKLLFETERGRPGGSMEVTVQRPPMLLGLALPEIFGFIAPSKTFSATIPVESVRQIGVTLGPEMVFDRASASEILPRAWQECRTQVGMVTGTLGALFSGAVSAKELGGPITIARVTMAAAEDSAVRVLRTMAFISLNLFILNLLPLPVLDADKSC